MSFEVILRSRSALALSLLSGRALFATPCQAAEPAAPRVTAGPDRENARAQARFAEGVRLFKRDKAEDALTIFRHVFEETRSPNAALYIGHCLIKLERYVEANTAFSLTLREIAKRPDDKYESTREAAVAQLSWLSVRVAKVVIALAELPEGLVVEVDGEVVAPESLGSELVLSPGQHRIEARAPGVAPVSREMEVAPGETKTISFSFEKSEDEESSRLSEMHRRSESERDRQTLFRILGFSAAGVGVVGMTVFTVAGLGAKSTYQGLEADCRESGCADASRRVASGKSQQTWANVGLGVGAVGLAASGVLLYFGFAQGSEQSVSLDVTPGNTSVSYRSKF